ncbi:hypothetical protein [Paenibacillus naphthalenovorans]|uniref:Core-binding (CB) domain-containing protein n=1 Tax=Paenibacillus naphthalenovorans TaxID=162209 RepID=A0A0U2W452_9BACL|nr:hypothetical protein [Paenibacillus naphthalenovorans]ALS22277.1 hypothetical protein IJ22_19030 [Paenibacillus naphthalenovorans]
MTQSIEMVQAEFDFIFNPVKPNPLDSSQTNERKKYTVTDANKQAWSNQVKTFELTNVNQKYLESFRNSKYPNYETDPKHKSSWAQYKCSCGNFMEFLNGKDAISITQEDINSFLSDVTNENTRANRTAHIKSMLTYALNKNISFCRQRASIFVLLFTDMIPEWLLNDKNMVKRLTSGE